jgi:D-lyxose ketol-isomerase
MPGAHLVVRLFRSELPRGQRGKLQFSVRVSEARRQDIGEHDLRLGPVDREEAVS